jgi:hypothetical protein
MNLYVGTIFHKDKNIYGDFTSISLNLLLSLNVGLFRGAKEIPGY